VQVDKRRMEALKEAEARRVEARRETALSDLLFYVDEEEDVEGEIDVEELRRRTEAAWMECDHECASVRGGAGRGAAYAGTGAVEAGDGAIHGGYDGASTGGDGGGEDGEPGHVRRHGGAGGGAGRCVFADNGNADEETLEDLPPRERCLRTAVVNGHVEAVIALLTAGAEVDRAATDGWTALNSAASGGNVEILRALLEAGAEVKHANTGRTPLAAALANNQEAAALALVQAGATTA
jgi:hypothetical protein